MGGGGPPRNSSITSPDSPGRPPPGNCLFCGHSNFSKSESTLWVFDYQSGSPAHHQLFGCRSSENASGLAKAKLKWSRGRSRGGMATRGQDKEGQQRRATIAIISEWFKTVSNHHYRCRRRLGLFAFRHWKKWQHENKQRYQALLMPISRNILPTFVLLIGRGP